MSIIAWIVLGLASGFIASKIVSGAGSGILMDLVLGVLGAVLGGVLFRFLGEPGVTGFNLWSALVSTTGAVLVLLAYHALSSPGTRRRRR